LRLPLDIRQRLTEIGKADDGDIDLGLVALFLAAGDRPGVPLEPICDTWTASPPMSALTRAAPSPTPASISGSRHWFRSSSGVTAMAAPTPSSTTLTPPT